MTRKTRNPNARLAHVHTLSAEKAIVEIREALVDIWAIVSPAPVSAADNYTVTGEVSEETVICTNTTAKTVTLPAFPDDLAEVYVKRTDAQVTVNGNGKNIDGSATLILNAKYVGVHLVYTDTAGEWSIV